jgi:mono/diheme cytochrome c family protein
MSSLEAINEANQANDLAFPFNQRPLMGIWKHLFHDNHATRGNIKVADDAYSRGEYLVEGLGHCGACHTPRNRLGAEDESLAFTGTRLYGHVKTGQTRAWSSSNLTRHHKGLDNWTTEDIAAYLKRGYNQHSVVHGPMNEVIVNSTSRATEDDILAMATYIHSLSANAQQSQQHEKSTQGEVLYTIHCGSCHLDNGQGDDILGVSLVNNAIVQSHDPATFINVILYGPHLPGAPFITDRSRMKMLGKRLSDKEIADIATFVRVNFNNNASPVSADEVAQQR